MAEFASSQARKRAIAAPSRICAARAPAISACVLDRLGQNAGIVAGNDLGAGGFEDLREAHRRRVRIEAHARRLLAKRRKPSRQFIRRKKLGGVLEMPPHVAADLGGIDEQRRLAARRHQGEGERERRVADVAAANVEQPGDGIEQRQRTASAFSRLRVSCSSAIFSFALRPASSGPCGITGAEGGAGRSCQS